MRLLLDENLPKRLKRELSAHEVYTVRDKGWNGLKNGDLLKQMLAHGFDALLTFDKNLQHQQNFSKYTIAVFVLTAASNQYEALLPLMPRITVLLSNTPLPPGPVIISLI